MIRISSLFRYPIKALAGESVSHLDFNVHGPIGDRFCVIVDENGHFISQRSHPKLSQLRAVFIDGQIHVSHLYTDDWNINIDLNNDFSKTADLQVKIWDDFLFAKPSDSKINTFFSDFLNVKCKLVTYEKAHGRPLNRKRKDLTQFVRFADGYPVLVVGEAALQALQVRANQTFSMMRFRPNIVLQGTLPDEEENWSSFQISDLLFHGIKPCARCQVININPENGEKGIEPLSTLSKYKKTGNKVTFGLNAVPSIALDELKRIKVGEEVKKL